MLLNILFFTRGGVVSASPRTPKLGEHPSSAVRDYLFNVFAAALHIGGRSYIRNLRPRHAVLTETHKHGLVYIHILIFAFHTKLEWFLNVDLFRNVTSSKLVNSYRRLIEHSVYIFRVNRARRV
jgi:hypothetical protein